MTLLVRLNDRNAGIRLPVSPNSVLMLTHRNEDMQFAGWGRHKEHRPGSGEYL